ncbi:MAG: hypothetical protein IT445_03910 [Phycisphaeraceae bacterium]|nr:hypothetical protein [Phycisphaeraceae bacterium]
MKTATWTISLVLTLYVAQVSMATALVEETFDYATGPLAGNNGGTGFDGQWFTDFSTATGTIDVTSGSIAFSDYGTTGNKVSLDFQTAPAFTSIWALRTVNAGISSGDMWYSYLYQRTDESGSTVSRTAEVRLYDGVIHFGTQIKTASSQGIKVRYEGSLGATAASVSIQDGNPYLGIAKFEDLGVNGALASFWVLSETAYDGIKAGGIDESELDGAAVLKATDNTNTIEVLTAMLDQLYLVNATSAYPFSFDIDEFRLGTTLADVVPVAALQPGDANGDGLVNLSDLQILGDNWQSTTATWAEADFTGDGTVNLADLQILGDNWGFGVTPDVAFDEALAGVLIPEPTVGALMGCAALLVLHRRNRR